jgi:hypothetical protein
MNAERAALWVSALRSGEFKQGRKLLRSYDGEKWCCLAVLCEVYRRETGNGEWIDKPGMAPAFSLDGYPFRSYAPPVVAEWMGLNDEEEGKQNSQAYWVRKNENYWSFERIADLIAKDAGLVTAAAV